MGTLAGPDASIAFTHLSHAASTALSAALPSTSAAPAPASTEAARTARAECHEQGVLALMQARGIPRERVCLLDPQAAQALSPSDSDGSSSELFSWFLFGVRLPRPFRHHRRR